MFSLATPSMVSSPGIVKIVVRQTAGKDGGPVPTLAVTPSPRVAPQVSPSPLPHPNTTLVRNTAPIQIVQRTPGPATAHYTIAPPGNPNPTQSQSQPPRSILKVVQPPSNTEQSGKKGEWLSHNFMFSSNIQIILSQAVKNIFNNKNMILDESNFFSHFVPTKIKG